MSSQTLRLPPRLRLRPRVATAVLAQDPAFGPLVAEVGAVRIRPPRGNHLAALVSAIVYQQLAGAAASTIHGRVLDVLDGDVTPDRILAADEERLRGAGLSGAKLASIRDLALRVADGRLELDGIDRLDDQAVRERLVTVRGIGPWTADMFLIFQLRRGDVWPTGDLGVRAGWARLHALSEVPDARALEPAADHLRPHRSAAAWYCWRAVETVTPG